MSDENPLQSGRKVLLEVDKELFTMGENLAHYIAKTVNRNKHLEVRVTQLLEANNREVERRRELEKELEELKERIQLDAEDQEENTVCST
jgi:hypothetical protein